MSLLSAYVDLISLIDFIKIKYVSNSCIQFNIINFIVKILKMTMYEAGNTCASLTILSSVSEMKHCFQLQYFTMIACKYLRALFKLRA